MEACEICSGSGTIEKGGKLFECECALLRRISAAMPPPIRKATVLPEHLRTGLLEKTGRSLFINVHWQDMKAILKAVMIKFPQKFVRITSDAEIRDVYVGSKSKSARSADYEGNDIYNNIEDLVGPPDLLVVKLNEIKNRNKAAPGALAEGLAHRLDRDKPTWVISCVETRFGIGSYAYSEAVAEIVSAGCERVTVPQTLVPKEENGFFFEFDKTQQAETAGTAAAGPVEDAAPSGPSEKPARPKRQIRSSDESDGNPLQDSRLASMGQGLTKKKKFQRRDEG
jgi:hypothetical protein